MLDVVTYDEATSFYKDDLPCPALVSTEVWKWREKWCKEDADYRPTTLQTADRDFFPNIYTFFYVLPVLFPLPHVKMRGLTAPLKI
jgi:hypothetical protein